MSATNRGTVRNAQDFYASPKEAFEPMLPFIKQLEVPVWEPACGDGRLCQWMNECSLGAQGNDVMIDGYNFIEDDHFYPCIITNPPFSLAFEFCQHAIRHANHVFLLLRLNFLASKKRREWFICARWASSCTIR